MPTTYAYKVRDREGKMAAGSMEAESEEAVVSRLRQLGYAPISIEAEKGAGLKAEVKLPGASRVKLKDLAVFSRQLATMINSGLSLLRALTILGEQTSNRRLGDVIVQVRAEVEKGTSLSAALARHPKVFNRLYVSMVRAGEIGGFLDQVLVKVAETFEKEVALRGKIRSAMTYPVVVFIMVIGIVGAMLLFIVPTSRPSTSRSAAPCPCRPACSWAPPTSCAASSCWSCWPRSCSRSCSAVGRPASGAATSGTSSSSRSRCSGPCSTRAPCPASPAPWPP